MLNLKNKAVLRCDAIGDYIDLYRANEFISLAVTAVLRNYPLEQFLSDMQDVPLNDELVNHNDIHNITLHVYKNLDVEGRNLNKLIDIRKLFVTVFCNDSIIVGTPDI